MYSALVYAANRQRAFAFGGWNGTYAVDAPWLFDGTHWSPELRYTRSPVNGNYYAVTPQMTWREAETLAIQQGGHLATVRSSAENAWLRQEFGPQDLWIGFNDRTVEGQWVWASGEPVTFTGWAWGEPNNSGNEDV
ncbi:MAG: lectin-like protein, partial [Phycisphaerae bacterium]